MLHLPTSETSNLYWQLWMTQTQILRSSERMRSSELCQSRSLVSVVRKWSPDTQKYQENGAQSLSDEFRLHVKVSPCHSLFAASWNVATSQPGQGGFACLLTVLERLVSDSHWKWWARGSRFPHENFNQFHPCLLPQKAKFQSCLAEPPPGGLLLSTLAPKWAAWKLNRCTQHCVLISHLHVPHQIFTPKCFSTMFQVLSC